MCVLFVCFIYNVVNYTVKLIALIIKIYMSNCDNKINENSLFSTFYLSRFRPFRCTNKYITILFITITIIDATTVDSYSIINHLKCTRVGRDDKRAAY